MKLARKFIAIILCLSICISTAVFSVFAKKKDVTPIVFVTGIGQSQTYVYDDDGNVITDGNLFVINTDFTVKDYITIVLLVAQLGKTLVTGRNCVTVDVSKKIVESLFRYCIVDENGQHVKGVETPCYRCPVSEYTDSARNTFLSRIPCGDLVDEVGADNVYCFNYSPFSNLYNNVEDLDDFIENVVLKQTGAEKVTLVPMSMGASVTSAYLYEYASRQHVEKVVSVVGAWNGSDVFADLIERKYAADAPDLIYNGVVADLVGEPYGYLVNLLLRVMPKPTLRGIIDNVLEGMVSSFVLKTPSLLALIPSERYEKIANEYLSAPELAYIKAQTDRYYNVQSNLKENLYKYQREYGIDFFFICGYDLGFGSQSSDYMYFQFLDSSKKTNSDEIIQISSTGVGTSYVPYGTEFAEDYKAVNPVCTDKSHNHISPDRSIDVSTSYFPERTWCFEGQTHELTFNNTALNLAFAISQGEVNSVEDCKDTFPQFNQSRDTRRLVKSYLPDAEKVDRSTLTPEMAGKLDKAVSDAKDMMSRTINNREEDNKVIQNLYDTLVEIGVYHKADDSSDALTKILKAVNDVVYQIVGPRGYSDFVDEIIGKILDKI